MTADNLWSLESAPEAVRPNLEQWAPKITAASQVLGNPTDITVSGVSVEVTYADGTIFAYSESFRGTRIRVLGYGPKFIKLD